MMNYEEFKKAVTEKFTEYLPRQYQSYKVQIDPMKKVNRSIDCIYIIEPGAETASYPTICIEDMYEYYMETGDLYQTLRLAAAQMGELMKEYSSAWNDINTKNIKEQIVFQLINTAQNEELLVDLPHRSFHDLSVIYQVVVREDEPQNGSFMINHQFASKIGLTENELFSLAMENTKRLFPFEINALDDRLFESLIFSGTKYSKIMDEEMPLKLNYYVVTNEKRHNAANFMLYEDMLHNISSGFGSDFYILPSSINEVIIVPSDWATPNELVKLVEGINMSTLSLEERLSNQVYCYDRDSRKVKLATDTPNKRLDVLVTEQKPDFQKKEYSR